MWELWYTDDAGNRLELLDNVISFEVVLVIGDVGAAVVKMPHDTSRVYNITAPDRRIHMYRAPDGGSPELIAALFSRRWAFSTDRSGRNLVGIGGVDPNDLLRRRIVAYDSDTTQALKTDNAGDMMKASVRENLGSLATDTNRDITGLGFSIQNDLGDGPSITKAVAWQNLLPVLQGIQASSKSAGTELYFAVTATTPTTFQFQTFTGQPGRDLTVSTGANPIIFGMEWGNLANPMYVEDYIGESNYIYAGGRGNTQEISDSSRINQSQWNRREGFASAVNPDSSAAVIAVGNDRLHKMRPKFTFTGELLPTPDAPYGHGGWQIGDKVTVSYANRQFDVLVRSVRFSVNENRQENIVARVENVSL